VDDKGTKVPVPMRYQRMLEKINQAMLDPKVDHIFVDSASFIEDILKARICGAQTENQIKLGGDGGASFKQWGELQILWKALVNDIRISGKKFTMSAHEEKDKDESDGIFKYNLMLDGRIRNKFPAIFSDVIRTYIQGSQNPAQPADPKWMVQCIGDMRQEHLKNTLGIIKPITQDEFVKLVQEKLK
jgi:hypothetical protein